MKKIVFLLGVLCLSALGAFAQAPNFAGEWKLDTSKLDERRAAVIKSQTISVTQDGNEMKATTTTERNAPPAVGNQPGPGRGFGGPEASTYKLDGSEVIVEREYNGMKVPIKTVAKVKDGKLEVSTSSTFTTPDGQQKTNTSKSTWELSADGKTLTVKSTRQTPNGEMTIESVYKKS